jgi:hypothetical protein
VTAADDAVVALQRVVHLLASAGGRAHVSEVVRLFRREGESHASGRAIARRAVRELREMGFLRTYWEFYRGFSITITVLLAALALFAWQIGTLSRRNPREAVPLATTMVIACVANGIVAFMYFFTAPMVISTLAVICAAVGLALTRREITSPARAT